MAALFLVVVRSAGMDLAMVSRDQTVAMVTECLYMQVSTVNGAFVLVTIDQTYPGEFKHFQEKALFL